MQNSISNSYDVAVIGAGVFGAWTAWQLQKSGKRVLMIDAHGPGNSRSSSGGESRIIRMGYGPDEIYTRSAQKALQHWQELFARSNQKLFHLTGVLWLAGEDDPYPERCAETLARVGVPFARLSPSEVRARYPQFDTDRVSWALLEPESGVLIARRAVQAVTREALRNGVEYLEAAVAAPNGSRKLESIKTSDGREVSAAAYVFACGAWLPKLFPELLADKIHPTRQEVFFLGAAPGDLRFSSAALPTWIDFTNEAYGMPDLEGRGVKVAIDRHGPPFDPETGSRVVTQEGVDEVRRYVARRLPALKAAPVIETRVCQYENTANGDFLIDRHPDFDNVWLAGGGSGHGFKHGPVVGEYVAAMIDGRGEGAEPRFALATKGSEPERAVY